MFRKALRLLVVGTIGFSAAGCLPEGKDDSGANPGSPTGGTPIQGTGGNANSAAAAMYSVDSSLVHRAPVDESNLEHEPVYFFLEPSGDWQDRQIRRVVYRCCKGIGGPAIGTPHGADQSVSSRPWSTYVDLAALDPQSTHEVELDVIFANHPSERVRAQFRLKGSPGGGSGSSSGGGNANSGNSGGSGNQPSGNENRAPVISGFPPTEVTVDRSFYFEPSASDPDGDTIAFTIANRPSWADFDSLTGRLTGTPTINDVGVYPDISVLVSDGEATTALDAFSVEVRAGSNGSVQLSWLPPTQRTDGSPLGNLAGYKLVFGQQPGSYTDEINIANGGISSYVVDNLTPGQWYFAITAYDASGLESALSGEVARAIQ